MSFIKKLIIAMVIILLSTNFLLELSIDYSLVDTTTPVSDEKRVTHSPSFTIHGFRPNLTIYIVGIYQQENSNVYRMIFIEECRENVELSLRSTDENGQSTNTKLSIMSVIPCRNGWNNGCAFNSYLTEFTLPPNIRISIEKYPHRQTASEDKNELELPIKIVQENEKVISKHQLAICMKAFYRYGDVQKFILFFEYYQLAGVTKFYVYIDSITVDLERIIDVFQKSGIEIELVDWYRFTDDPGMFLPNQTINNTGLVITAQAEAINDCLYRSRRTVEYVAVIDLDEIIIPMKHYRLIDWLQTVDQIVRDEDWAGVAIDQHEHYLDRYNAGWMREKSLYENLFDLSFSHLVNIEMDEQPHKPGFRRKSILRPTRVKLASVHFIRALESDSKQSAKPVGADDVRILHMRSIQTYYGRKNGNITIGHFMAPYAENMTKNWQERFRKFGTIYESKQWSSIENYQKFEIDMEKCFQYLLAHTKYFCFTQDHCDTILSHWMDKFEWKIVT